MPASGVAQRPGAPSTDAGQSVCRSGREGVVRGQAGARARGRGGLPGTVRRAACRLTLFSPLREGPAVNHIESVMTRDPTTLSPEDSVQRGAQLMDELNVGAMPVCVGLDVVGIVTDRDITVRATAAGLDPRLTPIELVMSDHVRCCRTDDAITQVLDEMAAVQIRRMPVLDARDQLVGIVSLGDIAARRPRGVEEALRRISTPAEPDRETVEA